MPQVKRRLRQLGAGHVRSQPRHPRAADAQALAGDVQGLVGQVEHSHLADAPRQQVVHQR